MTMKTFKTTLLTIVVLLCSISASAYDFEVDGICYTITSSEELTVEIAYKGPAGYSGNFIIPNSVKYDGFTYSVTSIGSTAFQGCSGLTNVTIGNSVISIRDYSFVGCSGLTSVDIPNTVTNIGNFAFKDCYNLTNVFIPNSVTSIGRDAFKGCSNLPVENYVRYAGNWAVDVVDSEQLSYTLRTDIVGLASDIFDNCLNMKNVEIPNTVKIIGNGAFSECRDLTEITIPNSVTSIGNYAFSDCLSLTSVIIPNYVKSIGYRAFSGCASLTSIVIGNSVTSIGIYAFENCKNLKTVINLSELTIEKGSSSNGHVGYYANKVINPDGQIGDFSFKTTDGINYLIFYIGNDNDLVLPENYKGENYAIEKSVFSNFTNLTSITIPNSVTSIGGGAFYKCSNLTSITIPNSVTSIGDGAFEGCSGLTNVTIGNSVIRIRYRAFYNCSSLTNITIPNSVTNVGNGAFFDCLNLANVVFENQKINLSAFNCRLKSLTIGAEVTSISGPFDIDKSPIKTIWLTNTPPEGYSAAAGKINYVSNEQYKFSYNKKYVYPLLSSMFEVDGVTYVPVNMSERTCDAIHVVHNSSVGNMAVNSTVSYKGIAMTVKEVMPYTFYNNDYIKTLSVDNAGNIGEYAFYGCDSLQAVTLGESITNIEKSSFESCSALTKMTIPNSVITLGEYCFRKCTSMQSVELGNGLTTIEKGAFTGCSALSSISIPSSVTKVSDYVFSNCTSMTKVVIEDRTEALSLGSNDSNPLFANCPLNSVYIGGKISYSTSSSWGYSPFYRNTSLESVVISDHENTVYDNEFYGCTGLKNVTIGNGVKSIGKWAFSGCGSLDKFSFGGNVESIGQEAFSDCTGMTELVSYAVVPPTCGAQALEDINKWECTLKVPESCKAAYQEADQWKDFLFTEDVLAAQKYTLTYTVDGKVFHTESIALNAAIPTIETPTKEGYTFSAWSELPATMPANDVTVEGSFAVNSYRLVYQLDGAEYSADSIAYGTELVLKDALTKEGHTFSGWSELPATMPANDVTVEGSFMVNKYKLTYVIDGVEYKTDEIAYGASITFEATPTKEGYIFSGWSEIPETMPAKDVVVTGSFTVDGIEAVVSSKLVDVYTLQGVMVKRQIPVEDLEKELPNGLYIVNGKKFVVK